MATFFDRKALNEILTVATQLRKGARRGAGGEPAVYLVKAAKPSPPPAGLKAIHARAIEAFGGKVVRDLDRGLAAVFEKPFDALKAGLHALHSLDLAAEMVFLPPCRVAIAVGPIEEGKGRGLNRAAKILSRAGEGEVVLEPSILREPLTGYRDITAGEVRRSKIPGLGPVATITVKPGGFSADKDEEFEDVEDELRTQRRR